MCTISEKYDITITEVYDIKTNENKKWSYLYTSNNYKNVKIIKDEIKDNKYTHKNSKFEKEDDILKIYKLLDEKEEIKNLANYFNVSPTAIYRIRNGKTFKHLYTKENYKNCINYN